MSKKKLNLEELKVQSFITSLEDKMAHTIRGGEGEGDLDPTNEGEGSECCGGGGTGTGTGHQTNACNTIECPSAGETHCTCLQGPC